MKKRSHTVHGREWDDTYLWPRLEIRKKKRKTRKSVDFMYVTITTIIPTVSPTGDRVFLIFLYGRNARLLQSLRHCTSALSGSFSTPDPSPALTWSESFYDTPPPKLFLTEIAGFESISRPCIYPEIRCPLPPRRRRSVDASFANDKKICEDIPFIAYFLLSSCHETFVKENHWFRGGAGGAAIVEEVV